MHRLWASLREREEGVCVYLRIMLCIKAVDLFGTC